MFGPFLQQPRHTIVVFGSVLLLATIYILTVMQFTRNQNNGNIGAMLDDTWIHVRFADEISRGNGLMYNQGVVTSGATSPLWVLLLAIPYALFNPDVMQQVDIAIYTSTLSYLLLVTSITGFGWWLGGKAWVGFSVGMLCILTGRWIWMGLSGMETVLFTVFCILSIWSHSADQRDDKIFTWRTGILLAFATLARPEAGLLAVLVGIDAVFVRPFRDVRTFSAVVAAFRRSWRGIIAYVLLAVSYPIVPLIADGYPVPNTFRAKSQLGEAYPDLPRSLFWMNNVDNGQIYLLLAGVGLLTALWQMRRKNGPSALWAVWPIVFGLAVLYMGPERYVINHSRYMIPGAPFVALLAVMGIDTIHRIITTQQHKHLATAITVILLGTIGTTTFVRGIPNGAGVANDVGQLYAMHIPAGYWLKAHTDPDATIALNDVGAMVHISDRRVLDLEGLVSPESITAVGDAPDLSCPHDLGLAREMMRQHVRFVGIFPWWYPCLSNWTGALQPETVFTITGPTVIAGGELVIYYPVWENWPIQMQIDPTATPVDGTFTDHITLAAYDLIRDQRGLVITLWWQASGTPRADYHVFVHVVDGAGQLLKRADGTTLQHDSLPQQRANSAFSTLWWRDGDIIPDVHIIPLSDELDLSDPTLSLNIGLYTFPNFERLPRPNGESSIKLPLNIRTIASDVAQ